MIYWHALAAGMKDARYAAYGIAKMPKNHAHTPINKIKCHKYSKNVLRNTYSFWSNTETLSNGRIIHPDSRRQINVRKLINKITWEMYLVFLCSIHYTHCVMCIQSHNVNVKTVTMETDQYAASNGYFSFFTFYFVYKIYLALTGAAAAQTTNNHEKIGSHKINWCRNMLETDWHKRKPLVVMWLIVT